jgi:hypothetical protein
MSLENLDRLETIDPRLTTTIGDHYVIPPHTFHMFFYFFLTLILFKFNIYIYIFYRGCFS